MSQQASFLAELANQQAGLTEALQQVSVQINAPGRRGGRGTGVIWSADGLIITNAHVVTGSSAIVQLADGRSMNATVVDRNRTRDLVSLHIDGTDLPAAIIGNSDELRVGELVLALGNPLGFTPSLTTGIVHALGTSRSWIQADVTLAPGNSGGLLANAQGQVVGINTMIVEGRGFAIPSNVVQKFLHDRTERPTLGVTLQPVRVRLQQRSNLGLMITQIEPGSPAETAKLRLSDVLIGIRGQLFQSANELFYVLENSQIGDGLPLDFVRDNRWMTTELVLWNWNPAQAA
jgi:serine protease Do